MSLTAITEDEHGSRLDSVTYYRHELELAIKYYKEAKVSNGTGTSRIFER